MGDGVYFFGASQTPAKGYTLEHGAWGEVTGPAPTDSDRVVAVRFPGNDGQVAIDFRAHAPCKRAQLVALN